MCEISHMYLGPVKTVEHRLTSDLSLPRTIPLESAMAEPQLLRKARLHVYCRLARSGAFGRLFEPIRNVRIVTHLSRNFITLEFRLQSMRLG